MSCGQVKQQKVELEKADPTRLSTQTRREVKRVWV